MNKRCTQSSFVIQQASTGLRLLLSLWLMFCASAIQAQPADAESVSDNLFILDSLALNADTVLKNSIGDSDSDSDTDFLLFSPSLDAHKKANSSYFPQYRDSSRYWSLFLARAPPALS